MVTETDRKETTHIFDAVMVCCGNLSEPSLPLHCFPGTVCSCLLLPAPRGRGDKKIPKGKCFLPFLASAFQTSRREQQYAFVLPQPWFCRHWSLQSKLPRQHGLASKKLFGQNVRWDTVPPVTLRCL